MGGIAGIVPVGSAGFGRYAWFKVHFPVSGRQSSSAARQRESTSSFHLYIMYQPLSAQVADKPTSGKVSARAGATQMYINNLDTCPQKRVHTSGEIGSPPSHIIILVLVRYTRCPDGLLQLVLSTRPFRSQNFARM